MVFNQALQDYGVYFLAFLTLWLLVLSFFLFKYVRHYHKLISKTKKKKLNEMLEEIIKNIDKQGKNINILDGKLIDVQKDGLKHLQKVGFLRFNPFSDTGGDQSFVLSILDGEENGLVLSSLHSRGVTRLYAKSIKKGKTENSQIKLSKEEKEALKKAARRRK
jgi:hypothetical protein